MKKCLLPLVAFLLGMLAQALLSRVSASASVKCENPPQLYPLKTPGPAAGPDAGR